MKHNLSYLFIFVFIVLPQIGFGQIQLGGDIEGENQLDLSGTSVSLSHDGNRVAIGSPESDGNGFISGQVRVFEWDGQNWVQLGDDLNGENSGDLFGSSVSLSGDGSYLAVGARNNSDSGINSGHVRVFLWDGQDWIQLGSDIDGQGPDNLFGSSVSLSENGHFLASGAIWNSDNGNRSGQVRVFRWNGISWEQLGNSINGENFGDNSGGSISLSSSGQRIAIGARDNDGNGNFSGQIRVFHWDGQIWTQLADDIDGNSAGDRLGNSVMLSGNGNRLIAGAIGGIGVNSTLTGYAKVFEWKNETWQQLGNNILGEQELDQFGYSVSISGNGDNIAVGSQLNDGNGISSGHVRYYEWNDTTWIQVGLDIDGETEGDESGTSVSLSFDGSRLAIGSPRNQNNGFKSGHVRVFDFSINTSIDQNYINQSLAISPNPFTDYIRISGYQPDFIRLFDQYGQQLVNLEKPDSEIDLSQLPNGFYFIQIEIDGQIGCAKLYKQ